MESLPETVGVEYRAVEGWPGYAVGDDGSVWSCRTHGGRIGDRWLKRNCTVSTRGYVMCSMSVARRTRMKSVHGLVCEAFLGSRPSGLVVCHGDGDKTNNRLSNLRYDTQSGNEADKDIHGTKLFGDRHGRATLSNWQASEILRRYRMGERQVDLAREFGVTTYAVHRLVHRKNWLSLGV